MALIHTIQVASEKKSGSTVSSTRKSETRRYEACIVATTTEATIAFHASKREEASASKAVAEKTIALLTEKLGMTVEAAKAKMDVESSAWFKAFFDAGRELRVEHNSPYARVSDTESEARAIQKGASNPYKNSDGSKSDISLLLDAAGALHTAKWNLSHHAAPLLGSEAVLSWHHTVALASKAMGSHHHVAARGDKLTIRTDIVVTETQKRTPKTAG